MTELREKIAEATRGVFGGAARKQSYQLADAILDLPEIKEALFLLRRQMACRATVRMEAESDVRTVGEP